MRVREPLVVWMVVVRMRPLRGEETETMAKEERREASSEGALTEEHCRAQTQHTLACSRFNINLEYMYDFFDSSVFRLIKKTLDNANDKGKSAIVCGEICNSEIGEPLC